MIIFGIGGTNGSGKDTACHVLAEKHGFYSASANDMLTSELKRRGTKIDRESKRNLSAEWRREHGMAVIIDKAVVEAKAAGYDKLIVGSLRHPGEADRVHELGGKVIWVDADSEIRYSRISAGDRGRPEDKKTFEEFLADEAAEKQQSGDAATLSTDAVKERADIFLTNNESVEVFEQAVEEILGLSLATNQSTAK